jgi:hypothetical protein
VAALADDHDWKDTDVWRIGGHRESVQHNRTVIVDKARHGKGAGLRFAFKMEKPEFCELGVIAPKDSKRRSPWG